MPSDDIAARVSIDIDALPDSVGQALTTKSELKTFFFGADVDSDFKVGSPIRMRGTIKGKAYEDKGTILVSDPPRRLSFSHYSPLSGKDDRPENYHVVTFDLLPQDEGTKVTLTQTNLAGPISDADVKNRAEYEKKWRDVLEGLRDSASSLLV